jgi:multidrug transporter EmrE-like cation transporter
MNMLRLLLSGSGLAVLDMIGYYIIGQTHRNRIGYVQGMALTSLIYVIQPFIMHWVLQMGGTITVLNLSWDCLSSIIVTLLGVFYFKDTVKGLKRYGIMFALLAVFLFALDEMH